MCGRYTIFTDADERELLDIIAAANLKYGFDKDDFDGGDSMRMSSAPVPSKAYKTGEIFPGDRVPALTLSQSGGGMSVSLFKWGFTGVGGNLLINARRETVADKPTFRESFVARRAVIPSTGFYEWTHTGRKIKYLFNLPDTRMLYMAGIWRPVTGGEPQFVILTADANESVAPVHNRMPLIIARDRIRDWMTDPDAALEFTSSPMPELVKSAG